MKKIINALLCTALLVSNLTAVSYAEESDKNNYTTIDISSVANAPIYAKEGDTWSGNYVATAPEKGRGIDYDSMQALLTNSVFEHNNTPYKFDVATNKNTAISTGGLKTQYVDNGVTRGITQNYNYTGVDVDIADGCYSELKILASAAEGNRPYGLLKNNGFAESDIANWNNTSKLAVVLQYTDGTYDTVETMTAYPVDTTQNKILTEGRVDFPTDVTKIDTAGNSTKVKAATLPDGTAFSKDNFWHGFKVKTITNFNGWTFGGKTNYSKDNGAAADIYINEYTFPVDSGKVLKNIHIVGSCADYTGVIVKQDGTVDYSNAYAASNINWSEGMYGSMVYAMTAVTKDSDLQSVLSTKITALGDTVTETDIKDIKAILDQANALGADLGEVGIQAQAIINKYTDDLDSQVTVYEKVDITPYANQAAYAKVGDLAYSKTPDIGSMYQSSDKTYVPIGVSVDHFKNFGNQDGIPHDYFNNWTGLDDKIKVLPAWGTWETGETKNTLTFRDIPYLMNVATDAYTNINTGADEFKMTGVNVDIKDGYYNELKIMSTATNPVLQKAKGYKNWNNMSKLALKLDYADGSYDVVDYMVNEQAAEHSLSVNNAQIKIIDKIKTNNKTGENSSENIDPQSPGITSYNKDGNKTIKQERGELNQGAWWNGFKTWSISLQNLELDWATKFGYNANGTTYTYNLNYQTNKDIKATLDNLSEDARNKWIAGTEKRYMYGASAGKDTGINVFTVPVDNSKVLVNVHFVGSLASNDGVQVDKNGNVIYSQENAIANGSGAYNNSIWAVTAVANKKDIKAGFKAALKTAQNAEKVTAEMIANLKGAYAQMNENGYEIDTESTAAYNAIVAEFGTAMKADLLNAADSNTFIGLYDKYVELGYTVDNEITAKKNTLCLNMPAYFIETAVNGKTMSARLKSFDATNVSGVLVAAVYDANGMIECKVENGVTSGNTVHTFNFDSNTDGKTIKLFALNDFAGIEPLALRFEQ